MRKRKTLCTRDQVNVQKSRRNSNYHCQKKCFFSASNLKVYNNLSAFKERV